MTIVHVDQRAPEGELFSPNCFDGSVGELIPVKGEAGTIGTAMLCAAIVSDCGHSVKFVLDMDAELIPKMTAVRAVSQ